VRHIYIIVSDEHQIPAWFKPHPMVTFVYHRQVPPRSLPSSVSEYSLRVPLPTSPVATIRVARAALPSASSPIAESAQCTVPRNALVCGQQGRPAFSPTRKLAASPTAKLPLSAHPMRLGLLASCLVLLVQIFPAEYQQYLPTFCSSAIECFIDRIPALSSVHCLPL
jgi:hypothetical protein